MSGLEPIAASAELSAIDLRFADLIARLARSERDDADARVLEVTAALVSRERGRGHPSIDLNEWAGRSLGEAASAPHVPELEQWLGVLRKSSLVGSGAQVTPLVLDNAGRCYLYRYWIAERRLAARILECARTPAHDLDLPALAPAFRELFNAPPGQPDWQGVAAAAVLRNRLTVISGGPGTGKTTTVARVSALLASHDRELRIALAAPTGKAAARLGESMQAQAAALPVAAEVRAVLAGLSARTIHRLLGYQPGAARFRYDAERPLACDVLIVDEASMIDLLLMDALIAAVPAHARIVLVGDKDQLASVEAGFVFGDLCEVAPAGGAASAAFANDYRVLSGRDLHVGGSGRPARAATSPLADLGVELKVGWRFRDSPGIEAFASAVKACDAAAALAVLDDDDGDVQRKDLPRDPASVVEAIHDEIASVVTAATPEEALERLGRARILCATNRGPWGIGALNLAVERALDVGGHPTAARWYRGRPLLVTTNDYGLGLFNGDVGVCFPDEEGRTRAWFATAHGLRAVAPAKLPEHETAWAMTVHKSQGSEFDRIVFVVPERDSPLLTRELVYTAVTRAREQVTMFAGRDVLAAAVARRAERGSGLREILGA